MVLAQPADLLTAMPQPALLVGQSQRIEAANPNAEALIGGGMVGRHYAVALRQPGLLDAIESVWQDDKPRTARYLGRTGERDTTWSAHVAPAGRALLVSFEDRTLAEEAGQMRRDFVANVSHELKTPLTAISGFIETLRGSAKEDPLARDRFLEIMAHEAHRMNRLVRDLLSLSRLEADERMRPTGAADLRKIIESVLAVFADTAAERNITLDFDAPPGPSDLVGDPDQLRQVFTNLVENALKYGGGQVSVRIKPDRLIRELRGPGYRVDVADDGPGIDAVHLPRLTERFYRVDTHRSREVGGTGLGLAIVKHIVSRHRGRLRVHSIVGEGTTFSILLPIHP